MPYRLSDGSIFLHNPRCGGTFADAVFRRLAVRGDGIGEKHDCPGVVPLDMTVPHRVFVRHPYHWIKSVWAWEAGNGWPAYPKYEQRWWHPFAEITPVPDEAKTFEAFLYWIANEHTGFVTSTFMKFANWYNSDVYDTDCMDRHLPILLEKIGVDAERAAKAIAETIAAKKPRNDFPLPEDASPQARAVFYHAEATIFKRFGYAQEKT